MTDHDEPADRQEAPPMIGAERFGADLATLDQSVELLTQTANTIRDLRDHPGAGAEKKCTPPPSCDR